MRVPQESGRPDRLRLKLWAVIDFVIIETRNLEFGLYTSSNGMDSDDQTSELASLSMGFSTE